MGSVLKTIFGAIMVPLFMFIGLGVMFFVFSKAHVNIQPILTGIVAFSPIWIPFTLFYITFDMWMWGMGEKWKFNNGRTTLRIKLPQEVLKSPEAMESILTQIHNVNTPDNLMQTYLDGKRPLTFSLELVSIGGDVRFYINVPTKKIKNALEAQLYAQYPGIEVTEELLDYTAEVKWDPEKWDMIAFHMGKKKDSIFPTKTYIDYKLDQQPKEELKFEPMSPMLEQLGSIKPHERLWIQFLITPHVEKTFKNGSLTLKPTWEKNAKEEINKIMRRDQPDAAEETESRPILTFGERDVISAIERNVSKYAYETGIRWIYITEIGRFDPDVISPTIRSFAQYDMIGRNAIGVRWRTDFNYNFFQDFTGARKKALKKRELEFYKLRKYYPGDQRHFIDKETVFSVEELATMYHIPGTSVLTPGLSRVENTRREAPSNLPIGEF